MKTQIPYYASRISQIFKRVSRRALFQLHGRLRDTITIPTKQGILTMSTKDQGIAAPLYRDKQFEYDYSIRAIKFLKEAGYIPQKNVSMLDVGSNIGIISIGLILAKQVDLAVAIEPEPRNFELLCKNVDQNQLSSSIVCLPIAVGDKESTLDMELSLENAGDHRIRVPTQVGVRERQRESARKTIRVKSLPISHILSLPEVSNCGLSTPSFMWIDIQGFDGYAFKGLENSIPSVSEVWPYGILRSGLSLTEYTKIVGSIWSDFWVDRREHFTRYPITVFERYLAELGTDGYFENVIFTK